MVTRLLSPWLISLYRTSTHTHIITGIVKHIQENLNKHIIIQRVEEVRGKRKKNIRNLILVSPWQPEVAGNLSACKGEIRVLGQRWTYDADPHQPARERLSTDVPSTLPAPTLHSSCPSWEKTRSLSMV